MSTDLFKGKKYFQKLRAIERSPKQVIEVVCAGALSTSMWPSIDFAQGFRQAPINL
jgi:hypothetical protein